MEKNGAWFYLYLSKGKEKLLIELEKSILSCQG